MCRGAGSEWHHRRSRSVRGGHRHCPCNGLLLCYVCHPDVHSHPTDARLKGLIVSRHVDFPGEVPLRLRGQWWIASCEGLLQPLTADQVVVGTGGQPERLSP